jgi:uncharacterized protein YndB with AHSA1/START domain
MADLTIASEIIIDAPADVVWRTITEPEQMARWFADRVELDLRPGGEGAFGFQDKAAGSTMTAPLVVETVDAPHRFSFRWSHPQDEAPRPGNSMLVEFTLVPEDAERTLLRVVESGFDDLDWSREKKAEYAADHRNGWAGFMGRLGDLLATSVR